MKPRRFAASLIVCLLMTLALSCTASAADEPPYEFDPTLTLNGNCSTSAADPIPDPSCPYAPPPAGPTPSNCSPAGCSSQFEEPRAIAIDRAGNEYVASFAAGNLANGRVDVFDDEGHFITEVVAVPRPKSIAVDSKGNLYVFESDGQVMRYPAKKYEAEAGVIEYGEPPVTAAPGGNNGAVAVDSSPLHLDQLLVLDGVGVITRYSSAENGNEAIDSFNLGKGFGNSLAIDSQRRRLYASYCKNGNGECVIGVFAADAPHTLLKEIDGTPEGKFISGTGALGVAADEENGDFFILDLLAKSLFRYDESYSFLSGITSSTFGASETINVQIAVSNGTRSSGADPCKYPPPAIAKVPTGDACNRHYVFIPRFRKTGSALAYRRPNQAKPKIEAVSTGAIGETEAELRAAIDPRGLETEYHFELTTQEAFEAEGFEGATILGEGTIPADDQAGEVSTFATGLLSGQTYRFRAVAANELGSALEEGQNEATFATYEDAAIGPPQDCPNQAVRVGISAFLPDCRAYELVTPADTLGRSPRGVTSAAFTTHEASPTGEAVSFNIEGGSLPGTTGSGAFFGDPYVSRRGSSGWVTELAGPTGDEAPVTIPQSHSPDQGYSVWTAWVEGPLVVEGQATEYLRYPDGHSEMLGVGSLGFDPSVSALLIAENGTHILFSADKKLEPEAPPTGTWAIYDRTIDPSTGEEEVHVVSLLPGDVTPEAGEDVVGQGESADGEGVAFKIGKTIYLRVGNEATYEIGEDIEVAGVAEGGQRVLYLEGGDLKAFDVASKGVIDFSSTGDVTPVNIAPEGTRVAFVSPSVLGGANPEGEVAQAGEQNLYLSEEGAISFLATVTDRDVEGGPPPIEETNAHDGLGLWMEIGNARAYDPSRFNPGGSVLLFQSRANLTGFPASEFAQIYRYDSTAGTLQCISCPPTKTPATGGASLQSYRFGQFGLRPLRASSFVPNLTPDGRRVFFDSTEALVSSDTDERTDVYEWEADGVGSCEQPEGCVYLISSGRGADDQFLYAMSSDGRDVFFSSSDRLTNSDPSNTPSIYDARVNGGFGTPEPAGECLGEACQPTVSAPEDITPTSAAFKGEGNVKAGKSRPRCPKGKRKVRTQKGRTRCVPQRRNRAEHKRSGSHQRRGKNKTGGQGR